MVQPDGMHTIGGAGRNLYEMLVGKDMNARVVQNDVAQGKFGR